MLDGAKIISGLSLKKTGEKLIIGVVVNFLSEIPLETLQKFLTGASKSLDKSGQITAKQVALLFSPLKTEKKKKA